MKLLFDENLSPKLPRMLMGPFPQSLHVRECGLKGRTDIEIWEYARASGLTIISKDSDFYHRSILLGPPPRLIWLRIGNCTRDAIVSLIAKHVADIDAFERDPVASILVLY